MNENLVIDGILPDNGSYGEVVLSRLDSTSTGQLLTIDFFCEDEMRDRY
jgi:hypothetical protein